MAQWKTYTIKDIIGEIECGNFVLPIIQRELVWDKDKIIALFETIMLQESFGGIMTVVIVHNVIVENGYFHTAKV